MQDERSILLVEDDRIDAMVVRRVLKGHCASVHVVHVADGCEALEVLTADRKSMPEAIVLDMHAPRMSGLEFLNAVKQDADLASIPVIALSGSDEAEDKQKALEAGACAYVVKSTDFEEFSESLQIIEHFMRDASKLPTRG